MLRHRTYLGVFKGNLLRFIYRHRTIGEDMIHQAPLKLPRGYNNLLGSFLGFLNSAKDMGDGLLFGEGRKMSLKLSDGCPGSARMINPRCRCYSMINEVSK